MFFKRLKWFQVKYPRLHYMPESKGKSQHNCELLFAVRCFSFIRLSKLMKTLMLKNDGKFLLVNIFWYLLLSLRSSVYEKLIAPPYNDIKQVRVKWKSVIRGWIIRLRGKIIQKWTKTIKFPYLNLRFFSY